jgi:uncharacterized protein (TIGR02117 family)
MRNARLIIRVARGGTAALALAIIAYVAAALIGGAWPVNQGWRPASAGVTVFVEAGAIHTGLVLPKVAAGVDWRGLARPGDIADPRYAGYDHVAIGWGERGFFLGTPTWLKARPGPIVRALTGSDATLMHVEHVPAPAPGRDERPVTLTPAEYRRLAAFIAASFRPGGRRWRGYGPNDAFYDARGRYDAIRTCNSWTGEALRYAGVRMGAWTPLPGLVTWWLPAPPDRASGG